MSLALFDVPFRRIGGILALHVTGLNLGIPVGFIAYFGVCVQSSTYAYTPLVVANGLRWQRRQEVQDVMANSTGVRFQRKVARVRSEPSRCLANWL